jgi:hypothetical protein
LQYRVLPHNSNQINFIAVELINRETNFFRQKVRLQAKIINKRNASSLPGLNRKILLVFLCGILSVILNRNIKFVKLFFGVLEFWCRTHLVLKCFVQLEIFVNQNLAFLVHCFLFRNKHLKFRQIKYVVLLMRHKFVRLLQNINHFLSKILEVNKVKKYQYFIDFLLVLQLKFDYVKKNVVFHFFCFFCKFKLNQRIFVVYKIAKFLRNFPSFFRNVNFVKWLHVVTSVVILQNWAILNQVQIIFVQILKY